MKSGENKPSGKQAGHSKRPYEQPVVKRVDLALAETLSAGCKLKDVCDDPFDPVSGAGS